MKRRFAIALLAVLLLSLAVGSTAAAPLLGGNTVYILNGEEVTFPFDPIQRKDGTLLPADVWQRLGVQVVQEGRTLTLKRDPVTATMALGVPVAQVNGQAVAAAPAPVLLSGRLFLPASLLAEFGFEVEADGTYLQIRDLTQGLLPGRTLDANEWKALKDRLSFAANIRSDDGRSYVTAEFTYLTPDLVASPNFTPALSFRKRVELLNLLQTHTLVMVRVLNNTGRAVTLSPASLMLVDNATGVQYDYTGTEVDVQGLISSKIASGAQKVTVLAYPKVPEGAKRLTVFADTNSGVAGTFNLP